MCFASPWVLIAPTKSLDSPGERVNAVSLRLKAALAGVIENPINKNRKTLKMVSRFLSIFFYLLKFIHWPQEHSPVHGGDEGGRFIVLLLGQMLPSIEGVMRSLLL